MVHFNHCFFTYIYPLDYEVRVVTSGGGVDWDSEGARGRGGSELWGLTWWMRGGGVRLLDLLLSRSSCSRESSASSSTTVILARLLSETMLLVKEKFEIK